MPHLRPDAFNKEPKLFYVTKWPANIFAFIIYKFVQETFSKNCAIMYKIGRAMCFFFFFTMFAPPISGALTCFHGVKTLTNKLSFAVTGLATYLMFVTTHLRHKLARIYIIYI